MRNVLIFCLFLISLFTACEQRDDSLGTLETDGLRVTVNSAGIGYDVVNERTLDSSKGLSYIVALSVTNTRTAAVQFTEESFRLFEPGGAEVDLVMDRQTTQGAVNAHAVSTSVAPGATEEILLMYRVKDHGAYRLQFVSPVSGKASTANLPAS
ncbi:MAG: DUF4352 domain-containing protein [Chitinophagaceae bacterium]|nr:MAG: DUF4352 domain-containing protein [Chitinophagaceae bacterium]